MKTYPLQSMTMLQAQQQQFRLVDIICRHFPGSDFLTQGDLGLVPGLNQPLITHRVEQVIADFFNTEAAALVSGAGTGALRAGLAVLTKPGDTLLVHDAPVYPTTQVSIEQMGIRVVKADFNHPDAIKAAIDAHQPVACLIQHTRQKMDDSYDLGEVIALVNGYQLPSLIDDNYAVMKVERIGCELGATLSTFSCFKLLGPPGVGVITGDKTKIEQVRGSMYSGGSQIQGFQAMEVLRGMVFAPVTHAVQAMVNDEVVSRLNQGEVKSVKQAFIANAQSKVLLVEFHKPIAAQVLAKAQILGALPYPVGAESRFEIPPLFYRVSGTFRQSDASLEKRMIRINPNRSGAETILRILRESCG
ncbi:aminotransferase class I/II-fold pyridoxal phosphate-dependent enzyme [Limnobaculum zhutongyuii]|uniref:Aminotransferase class I/II-fold pyridoxal phosphate-dependent enzyme n=1 Tax=Limnobaculum zhutongyuii TaxID=2498113 RepID=A0A411WNG4_9GAMM|nr:aminotransferase class I/II-fold pyridoxal phosphate-dependent enzyme [Limnobaculum zhutongyuii]QBH97707.1 aminotransferase class I/II-fold pyridoxal phosphate-dependent enzyme [Limnobaculum zhutongyuii]TQS86810.1 aminotransferase class I/II-fold pyridoxal phosphate-dependent enzyme [Limnobaculum zhutongyuii]